MTVVAPSSVAIGIYQIRRKSTVWSIIMVKQKQQKLIKKTLNFKVSSWGKGQGTPIKQQKSRK